MAVREPRTAGDYDDRTTAAVKSVLIEIGQILGSFEGKFAIIGGAVPWLLLGEAEMQHVGTVDRDFGLDPAALGDGPPRLQLISDKFRNVEYFEPSSVRRFVEGFRLLGDAQQTSGSRMAFGQVDAWLREALA